MKASDRTLFIGRAAEAREMDRRTIVDLGVPGVVLMEAAGAGTARHILERLGETPRKTAVVCGGGNNGGDGYVIARHLVDAGWTDVVCISTADTATLKGDAAFNYRLWTEASAGKTLAADAKKVWSKLNHAHVIVDALFGTGLSRPIEGAAAKLIEWANESKAFKVAVDLPSGVQADTGAVFEPAFQADLTATYGVSKIGLHQYPGASLAGEVVVVNIGLPRAVVEGVAPCARLLTEPAAALLVPDRPADGHKGRFRHVGIVGGSPGMEGAAVLTALGAFRAGAGLVTWNRPSLAGQGETDIQRPPELMVHTIGDDGLDDRSFALVVGPGLGKDRSAHEALALAVASNRSLVVDADGLNVLGDTSLPADTVITPHPAEAARLLGVTTADVQADRPAAALRLVDALGVTVVLKGAATLIAGPERPLTIVQGGQPALSVAGSGDVLAGVIASLRGQGLWAYDAARLGVYLHVRAGELVGVEGANRGALASDIADAVRTALGHLAAAADWQG